MSDVAGFACLPEELCFLILSFFDEPNPLLTIAAVNHQFHRLVDDDALWRSLFLLYKHERTPYDEINDTPFKTLFKRRFVRDRNWQYSQSVAALPSIKLDWKEQRAISDRRRAIHSVVATSGREEPLMAVSTIKAQVQVYDLKRRSVISYIPEECVRTLALILDPKRAEHETRLSPGVSRGWGNTDLLLVTGTRKIKVWKVPHRRQVTPLTMEATSFIRCMRAINDTNLLLTGSLDGSVKLWDIERGELVRNLEGFQDAVICLDVCRSSSKDSEEPTIFAVAGSRDCTAKIWNLTTGDTKDLQGPQQAIHTLLIEGNIVIAGAMDSTVRTWNLDTGEPLCLLTTHKTGVSHMAVYTYPVHCLLTICFDGVSAIYPLDDKFTSYSTRRLSPAEIITAATHMPYTVVGARDGTLSIFRLEPNDERVSMCHIRSITTGLAHLYKISVTKRGIIAGGFSKQGELSFLFYDFEMGE